MRSSSETIPSTTAAWLSRRALIALVCAWLLVSVGGFVLLARYKSTPGRAAGAAETWPATSQLAPASDRMTLVMLAHPHCPCTRASLEQLGRILGKSGVRARAYVVFRAFEGLDPRTTSAWKRVTELPGVTPIADLDGREAATFGATTSGHVMVFDPAGARRFSGGITGSRGHEGDNAGSDRVIALLTTGDAERPESPVFGCALEDR